MRLVSVKRFFYRNKASVGYMLMWIFVADMARPRETN